MLTQDIKQRVVVAMKAKNTLERDVLKVVLGDLQMGAVRKGGDLTEEEEFRVVKAMVKSMDETLAAAPDGPDAGRIRQEKAILEGLLPQTMSEAEVEAALGPVADSVAAAPSDGAATGVAMKHLKTIGAAVDGKVVAVVVRRLRGA